MSHQCQAAARRRGDVGVSTPTDERERVLPREPDARRDDRAEAGRVRVAATADPASDGLSFTFRRGDPDAWTLARLVDVETITPTAAGLLSVAVERGVTALVAGGRGAGKTTALGSLLWELPAETRSILIEDTPELPAEAVTAAGRDTQRLRVGDGARRPSPSERFGPRSGSGARRDRRRRGPR
ncbi:ATPase, T2SS/T4P/T4SS family [Halorubrum saccharovorum]|uniref:ATPase, T2SS/T4P/T4SS family n=1 Tax=Halorubrum saccharovorum TaxID=2248 RepID=UPI0031B5E8DB